MKNICQVILFCLIFFNPSIYILSNNTINRSITNGYAVGTIAGQANVTPTGCATYTIPIDLPKGCGGFTPELSIIYNSMSNIGNMGWGFSLEGLSSITRVPCDLFHDNQVTAVNFSDTDNYALDGIRLLRNSSNDTVFYPEINNFARVVSDSPTNPQKFTVYSPDGTITQYGYTSDSQVQGTNEDTGKVLTWKANRVSDSNGNYYTITYSETSDRFPTKINYSANSRGGIEPALSVEFSFSRNSSATNVTYINSTAIKTGSYLYEIKINKGAKCIRKYDFIYNHSTYPRLQSVKLTGTDGITTYNPTAFTWNASAETSYDSQTTNLSDQRILENTKHYVGDFNGDGINEILILSQSGATWNGYRICTPKGTAHISYFNKFNQDNISDIVVGDFNGDGKSDIVVIPKGDKPDLHLYLSTSDNVSYSFEEVKAGAIFTIPDKTARGYISGDFNGDGISDLLIYKKNGYDYTVLFSKTSNSIVQALSRIENHSIPHKWDEIQVADFNGNGINDIYNLHTANGTTYGTGTDIIIFGSKENSVINKHFSDVGKSDNNLVKHDVLIGDFNGDGKTDIAEIHSKVCYIFYSTGAKFNRIQSDNTPYNPTKYNGLVSDTNGDGKDDFYIIDTSNNEKLIISAATTKDNGKKFSTQVCKEYDKTEPINIILGDFVGNGKTDLFTYCKHTANNGSQYKGLILMNPKFDMPLLTTITDGIGNKTVFSYNAMRSYTIATSEKLSYPYRSPKNRYMHVVTGMSDGLKSTNYNYSDGIYHMTGRGFLGFKKFCQTTNIVAGTKVTTTFKLDNTLSMLGIDSTEIRQYPQNGNIISKTSYNTYVATLSQGTKMFQTTGSYTENFDINSGTLELTKLERITFDKNGNELTKVETTNGNDSIVSNKTYISYPERFIFGVLQTETTTKTRKGHLPVKTTETYTYTPINLLPIRKSTNWDSNLSETIEYTYDVCGNILSQKSAYKSVQDSVTSVYEYDADHRLVTTIIENSNYITRNQYDTNTDNLISRTDADGITTTYQTDAFGRKTKSTNVNETKTGTLYWASGINNAPTEAVYAVEKKATNQPDIIDFYDANRRKLRSTTTVFGEKTVLTDYEYYSNGKIRKEFEPRFTNEQPRSKFYQYDVLDRTICITYPDGTNEIHSYDNSITLGNKHTITDRKGNTTETVSNVYAEPISITDTEGNTVLFNYDSNGNCIEVRGTRTSIEMTYDGLGNRTSITDTDRGKVTYLYNARKELIQENEIGKSTTTTYKYNAFGNIIQRTNAEGTTTYTYHPSIKGRLLKTENATQSYTYSYDNGNHVSKETRASYSDTMQMSFMYEKNILKQIVYPNGFSITNEYENGTLSKIRHSFEADKIYWQLNEVDACNRPIMYTLGGNKAIKLAYDTNTGRPTRINNASQIIHTYSYDCLGNMLSHSDSINNQSETFRYDNLYRLIKVRQANNSYDEYQYDGAGNLLFKSSLGTLNYLDESNKIDFINADSTHLKQWPTIEYSSFNKVTKIKNSLSSYSIRYGLDQEPESTTDMFAAIITKKFFGKYYDSSNTYSDGKFIKSNICHIFAGDKEVCAVENGNINGDLYKYYDAMGSVIGTIKQSSGKLTEYSYDAWGRARDAKDWTKYTMSYPEGAGYCGHEYIGNYQIINMSGRMYDPIVGRFISPDPHVQDPSNSQNLNRYVYCLNNPLKYTDPTGEFFIIDDFLIGMVKGLVKGGWKRGWKEAAKLSSNSAKIWTGLFATGAGRNFWTASLELLSRFTYQSIQTTIGFTLMHGYNSIGGAINETGYVRTRYGAVVLPTRALGIGKAFTSGNYITANIKTKADPNNPTFQHEYGHYLQSLQLGPAYTSFISIPSLLNAAIGDNHKTQPYEMDANRRSFKFFHNKYPALAWYFFSNPLYCKQIKRSKESDNISQQDFNNNPYSMGYNEIYNW